MEIRNAVFFSWTHMSMLLYINVFIEGHSWRYTLPPHKISITPQPTWAPSSVQMISCTLDLSWLDTKGGKATRRSKTFWDSSLTLDRRQRCVKTYGMTCWCHQFLSVTSKAMPIQTLPVSCSFSLGVWNRTSILQHVSDDWENGPQVAGQVHPENPVAAVTQGAWVNMSIKHDINKHILIIMLKLSMYS